MPRYIDANRLSDKMYHEAFEKDSDMQKWDSGCWIRYKMFENVLEAIPTADVVERKKGKWIKADTHNYLFFKNDRVYKCEICGNLLDFEGVNGGRGDANYCPNCGAEIEGEDDA